MRSDILKYICIIGALIILNGCAGAPKLKPVEGDLYEKIDLLAEKIAAEMAEGGRKRVAVIEFTYSDGRETGLGSFLAEKLITRLHKTGRFDLIERSQLDKVMKEHKLSLTDMIDPSSAKELGKILGVEAIVTGTTTDLGKTVDINARLIGVETGAIFTTADVEVVKDQRVKRLLGEIRPKEPLKLHMSIIAEREVAGVYEDVIVREGGVLKSGDNLQVHFVTSEDCYVHILLYDSQGKTSMLFPDPRISLSNLVEGGREYSVPPGDQWFQLDENTGTETIYVLASYEPMRDIGTLLAEMESVGSIGRISQSAGIAGLDSKVYAFATRGGEKGEGGVVRGIKGITKGKAATYHLTDGTAIKKVTEVVKGEVAVVRAVSFYHR